MKNILILGGAGYVGGYLTDLLVKYGHSVTVYDNLLYENRYLKSINNDNSLKFIYGDIRDKNKLLSIMKYYDVIILLAAIVGDGACAINPEITKEVNEDAAKWICDNYNGKICYLSTCSVYGINNDLIDENARPNPISIYAATKLEAEQHILKNANNPLIFRLGTLYGIGDEHSRIRLDLVVNILSLKASLGKELCVFGGEQWRPLLHVKDVAHAIIYFLGINKSGLYNLSSNNYTIKQIAEEIQSIIPNSIVKFHELKYEDQRNYKVKNDKAIASGWMPKFNLKDGIKEINKLVMENRIKNIEDAIYSNALFLKNNGDFNNGRN